MILAPGDSPGLFLRCFSGKKPETKRICAVLKLYVLIYDIFNNQQRKGHVSLLQPEPGRTQRRGLFGQGGQQGAVSDWDTTYWGLALEGALLRDMPSANAVWGAYLARNGFRRYLAPDGITVGEFACENNRGVYILALSGHVVCIVDGVLYDTWDSSRELVLYYWQKG